jgi:hypothetical protein
MNCPSNLKFNFPAVSPIGVHSCSFVVRSSFLRFRPFRSLPSFPGPPGTSPHARKFHQTPKIYGPDNVQNRPITSNNVRNPFQMVPERTPLLPPFPRNDSLV